MKKYIVLFMCLFLTGCTSLIPKVNFNTDNTVPQKIQKEKGKESCKGKAEWDSEGNIISCSKGYYKYEEGYNKSERHMTLKEKVISFFRGLTGALFWIIVLLLIFAPSVLGFLIGKILEGSVGVTGRALRSMVTAVDRAKKNGGKFMDELSKEHSKDKTIKKVVNKLRADIS